VIEVKKKVGCTIHYLESRIPEIINATKPVVLEYEMQIEDNETWDITKLLIHGTAAHTDMDTVLGNSALGGKLGLAVPVPFSVSPSLSFSR
jgi:4-hydroxy-3-methylbut-2-enyl diphosphate reductase IspH